MSSLLNSNDMMDSIKIFYMNEILRIHYRNPTDILIMVGDSILACIFAKIFVEKPKIVYDASNCSNVILHIFATECCLFYHLQRMNARIYIKNV